MNLRPFFSDLPTRQKVLLTITLIGGILLLLFSVASQGPNKTINTCIVFYGFGIPLFLLCFPTIIDLNKGKIFKIWFVLAIVFLLICIVTDDSDKFLINRSAKFNNEGINKWICDRSTCTLKSLFFFLIAYYPLNQFYKKKKGVFIINTARKKTWFSEETNRKITALDVFLNFVLFFVIICAALFHP